LQLHWTPFYSDLRSQHRNERKKQQDLRIWRSADACNGKKRLRRMEIQQNRRLGAAPDRRRKLLWGSILVGSAILSAAAGFVLGVGNQSQWVMFVQQRVPFETYLTEQSFSEIENTRAKLNALASEFLTDLRARHAPLPAWSLAGTSGGNGIYTVRRADALDELQRGIEQFKGTEQEMPLIQELLYLLKKEKLTSRWIDFYLETLYEHPTDPLVARNAKEALVLGETLGRDAELAKAFDLIRRIPLQVGARQEGLVLAGGNLSQLDNWSAKGSVLCEDYRPLPALEP